MLTSSIFLKVTSTISLSLFLLLFGIVAGIVAGRVFLFHKYDLFLPVFKVNILNENGKFNHPLYQCPRLSHCIIFYRHWLVAFFSIIQAVKKRSSACRFSSFYLLFAFTIVFVTSITSTFSSTKHNSFVSSFFISSFVK